MGRDSAGRFVRRHVENGGAGHHADDGAVAGHGLRGKGVYRHHLAYALYGRHHSGGILQEDSRLEGGGKALAHGRSGLFYGYRSGEVCAWRTIPATDGVDVDAGAGGDDR